jgi:hypothetical protein
VAGVERNTDLEGEVALHRVEPLVLLVVEMPRGPALAHVGVLEDEEGAVRVVARDLDLQRDGAPDLQLFPGAVLAVGHVEALLCPHVSSSAGTLRVPSIAGRRKKVSDRRPGWANVGSVHGLLRAAHPSDELSLRLLPCC